MKKINVFLITLALFALCASPGYALNYSFDAPEDYLYGQPTSDDTVTSGKTRIRTGVRIPR